MTTYRRTTTDTRHDLPIHHRITADSPAQADAIARRMHCERTGAAAGDVVVSVPMIIAPRWRGRNDLNADLLGWVNDRESDDKKAPRRINRVAGRT